MKPLRVAVVGHTNTGKTSLLRTLARDASFGEVSDRPAVTRHVEGRALLVGGRRVMELYDTPGLEDSIGLLDHLQALRGDRRSEGIEVVRQFLASPEAAGRFAQEAKALRQVVESDVALYVLDARDRVLGKHRDELEILGWCARPIVPVLNFVASDEARTDTWREHLSRASMHAVAEFDTVVLDEEGETRLYEKMRSLLDAHREQLDELIADRRRHREELLAASARLIAELLIDVAAHAVQVRTGPDVDVRPDVDALRDRVRERERTAVAKLLELFRFTPQDYDAADLPGVDGHWGLDLFHPETLKRFGVRTGGAAAAGASVGLGLDLALAGLSLGTGTLAGAALGAAWGLAGKQGKRVLDRVRGYTELRVGDPTLQLLLAREVALVRALLRRGHASVEPLRLGDLPTERVRLPDTLREAKASPEWSLLGGGGAPSPQRGRAVRTLAAEVEAQLRRVDREPRSLRGGAEPG